MTDRVLPVVLVHGGAGDMDPSREHGALAGCEAAASAGRTVLGGGGAAIDAACAAVRVLEDNPQFNAGRGSVLTSEGRVEVDAALMRGSDLAVGAVAALPNGDCAIELARAVLEDSDHSLLAGESAWRFLRERGFSPAQAEALVTERSRVRLERELARRARGERGEPDPGTVGAVVVTSSGLVAAATSTGGTTAKAPGRIGDTPLIGCGTYADDLSGASSATGHGESIIAIAMASIAHRTMLSADAQSAAAAAVVGLDRVAGRAGIICVDRFGGVGIANNTQTMPIAYARGDQAIVSSARR